MGVVKDNETYWASYLRGHNQEKAANCRAERNENKYKTKPDINETHWHNFPEGTKTLFDTIPEVTTKGLNDGMTGITTTWLSRCCTLMITDSSYDWNLWKTLMSACIITSEFLVKGENSRAIILIFYIALIQESLAGGINDVYDWLVGTEGYKIHKCSGYLRGEFSFKAMYERFTYFERAVENTRTATAMKVFLNTMLVNHPTNPDNWIKCTAQLRGKDLSNEPVHCFDTMEANPEDIITIKLTCDGSRFFNMELYPSSTLSFVFNYAFAVSHCEYNLLANKRKTVNLRHFQSLAVLNLTNGVTHYLATSNGKEVSDIGIKDGDIFQVTYQLKTEDKDTEIVPLKSHSSSTKSKKTSNSKRLKQKRTTHTYATQELESDNLMQLHSKSMESVLNDLRPKLKCIRDELAANCLKNDPPKKRVSVVVGKEKENSLPDTSMSIPKEDTLGKAGKSVYPILVGEASNLFKITQGLRRRLSPIQVDLLDLHGCSRYKALGKLRKGLREWYDEAMRGEYPFVVSVDIICGKGQQVLSELVAQFIRDHPQVANRPKGM